MATPALVQPTDQHLLAEFRRLMEDGKTYHADMLREHTEKGEVTGETKERFLKSEAAMAELAQKMETEFRVMRERQSRPPLALGAGGATELRTLGQLVTEHEAYKQSNLTGTSRPRIQMALKGRVIPPWEIRAINPIITEAGSGLTIVPRRVGLFSAPTIPLVMRDLVDVIPLDGTNAIEYVIDTWTLAADYQVAEGDRKAQSDVIYTDKSVMVRTIAHYVRISRQMLADVPAIRAQIDTKLAYGIAMKEDKEILYGDNAAGHLHGIMPQATAFAAPAGVTAENRIEQIYAAIVQVMSAGYAPSAIVLNPLNFAGMTLSKNAQGNYVLGGPPASEATPRLWGLPVALTMNMTANDFLVGAFPGNAALFEREEIVVDISFSNEDDFVRNLVTIRAEERVALAVYTPQAFVKGTLMAENPATARTAERK